MVYEMLDITFFIMSLKIPTKSFDINGFIEFSGKALRSESSHKLKYLSHVKSNYFRHFYFNRLPRLWNRLSPYIDLNSSVPTLGESCMRFFGLIFYCILILNVPVHITYYVHVLTVFLITLTDFDLCLAGGT